MTEHIIFVSYTFNTRISYFTDLNIIRLLSYILVTPTLCTRVQSIKIAIFTLNGPKLQSCSANKIDSTTLTTVAVQEYTFVLVDGSDVSFDLHVVIVVVHGWLRKRRDKSCYGMCYYRPRPVRLVRPLNPVFKWFENHWCVHLKKMI